jgi:hypothetical protein
MWLSPAGPGGVQSVAWAQEAAKPETITGAPALKQVASLLQQRYARPVTYEDPIRRWRGDLNLMGLDRLGREILGVKADSLVMPEGLTPDRTPALGTAELARVLDAYQQQNSERARFRALESGLWLGIVPAQIRDESGAFVPAGSLLDTVISVPVGSRIPSEHLIALCQAVNTASHASMALKPNVGPSPGDWFNGYFAANGYMLRGSLRAPGEPLNDDDERPYILFEWGTQPTTARQALVDLMTRAGSTMSWHLDCGAGAVAEDTCVLNMEGLRIATHGGRGAFTTLMFDRCNNCRRVPTMGR